MAPEDDPSGAQLFRNLTLGEVLGALGWVAVTLALVVLSAPLASLLFSVDGRATAGGGDGGARVGTSPAWRDGPRSPGPRPPSPNAARPSALRRGDAVLLLATVVFVTFAAEDLLEGSGSPPMGLGDSDALVVADHASGPRDDPPSRTIWRARVQRLRPVLSSLRGLHDQPARPPWALGLSAEGRADPSRDLSRGLDDLRLQRQRRRRVAGPAPEGAGLGVRRLERGTPRFDHLPRLPLSPRSPAPTRARRRGALRGVQRHVAGRSLPLRPSSPTTAS